MTVTAERDAGKTMSISDLTEAPDTGAAHTELLEPAGRVDAHSLPRVRIDGSAWFWLIAAGAMAADAVAEAGWRQVAAVVAAVALIALPITIAAAVARAVMTRRSAGPMRHLGSRLLPPIVAAGAVAAASAHTGDRLGAVVVACFGGALWVLVSYALPFRMLTTSRAASHAAGRVPSSATSWYAWVAAAAATAGGAAALAGTTRSAMVFAVVAWTVAAVGYLVVGVAVVARVCDASHRHGDGARSAAPYWSFAAATAAVAWAAGAIVTAARQAAALHPFAGIVAPASVALVAIAVAWITAVAVAGRHSMPFRMHGAAAYVALFAVCAITAAACAGHPPVDMRVVVTATAGLGAVAWSAAAVRTGWVRRRTHLHAR